MNTGEETTTTFTPINHLTSVTSTTELLAVMILALLAGALISLVLAHILDRGVNPIRDAVSDYGARKYKNLYRLTAFWLGFAGLLTAVMLGDALFPKPTLVILLLLVYAATRGAITMFPVDLPGEEQTSVGRSHEVLATLAFGSFVIAAAIFPEVVKEDPFWGEERDLLNGLALFALLAGIATGLTRHLIFRSIFGAVERVYYVAMFAWMTTIALILLGG